MENPNPRYLVGIDLGTTHTVVAFADLHAQTTEIEIFQIEQLVAPGKVAARPLLPSVRYHPAEGEISESDAAYSPGQETAIIGEAARVLGAKTKGRLVASAKSWLSHSSVDQNAAILPWGGAGDAAKVSPIEAGASYLRHVRAVWNRSHPGHLLENQEIVLTVPASFDEEARAFTVESAVRAGLPNLRLLEEPQAVFYDWLRRHRNDVAEKLAGTRLLLVCDVGGGTTDLTLIKIDAGGKQPKLSRIGVGDHLMLGGDNIDLALAHIAEKRIAPEIHRLSAADMSQLIEQCRIAKERLLSVDAPELAKVTLLGGGARLVGGARSAELTRREALAIALDGFFPLSSIDDLPDRKRGGIVEFGLPYAAEPAVSRHIAAFLHHYRHAAQDALEGEGFIPDAVLLNGGVFRSKKIVRRLLDLISSWRGGGVRHLDNPHPELAVAYGAVGYALARRGEQPKIGGGSARSYFLILDGGEPESQRGVCILPRGAEEGGEIILQDRQFALKLGQPVRFNLASLSGDADYMAGDIAEIDEDRFHFLPPLAVSLKRKESGEQTEATVRLSVMLTEIGTLRIQCVSIENPKRRWDVEFQIRNKPGKPEPVQAVLPAGFSGAAESVRLVFGKKSRAVDAKSVRNLRNELEKRLGPRAGWDGGLLRSLFTEVLDGMKYRRRSPAHERVWLNLAGFCLRPGFGYPLDDWRAEQLWEIYPQQIQFVNEAQNWAEWWTLWRRVAGGLSAEAQEKIFSDLAKYIDPASARQPAVAKQIKSRGYEDMVRLAAVLEHLAAERKIRLGEWLLKRLRKPGEPEQSWWALGRVGARVPFYGSSHNAVPPETASAWLSAVLDADWKKTPRAGFAAAMIARMSGDRARDIDDGLRGAVLDRFRREKTPSAWQLMVEQVRELDEKEEGRIFGESLPPGLKLI